MARTEVNGSMSRRRSSRGRLSKGIASLRFGRRCFRNWPRFLLLRPEVVEPILAPIPVLLNAQWSSKPRQNFGAAHARPDRCGDDMSGRGRTGCDARGDQQRKQAVQVMFIHD